MLLNKIFPITKLPEHAVVLVSVVAAIAVDLWVSRGGCDE